MLGVCIYDVLTHMNLLHNNSIKAHSTDIGYILLAWHREENLKFTWDENKNEEEMNEEFELKDEYGFPEVYEAGFILPKS